MTEGAKMTGTTIVTIRDRYEDTTYYTVPNGAHA